MADGQKIELKPSGQAGQVGKSQPPSTPAPAAAGKSFELIMRENFSKEAAEALIALSRRVK